MDIKQIANKLKSKYKEWEAGSRAREKRKLEKIYSKRAREALQHVYKMERAKRKYEVEEQLAKIEVMKLKKKKAAAASKKLGGSSSIMRLFDDKPKRKRR